MIDTHCHLTDPQFNKDLDKVLHRAAKAGIKKIINAGYDVKTSQDAVEMCKSTDWVLPAVGIHPNEFAAQAVKEMDDIVKILKKKKVSAIGETGLDYYRDFSPRDAQKELFRMHIDIARRNRLPLLIHNRNSVNDIIKILKEEDYHHGVFHCYSGTLEQAFAVVDMGFYLGFGGVLTLSKQTQNIFKKLPTDRIVLETDAPFLAPAGHRGERNEPAYIIETLNIAADILDSEPCFLEEIFDANAAALFALGNNQSNE